MNVTSVYVEITNQCNLNCRTCYNRSGLNRTRKELSCEDLEQLIQLFLPLGLKHLSLSGGEPTLHSAFHKLKSAWTVPARKSTPKRAGQETFPGLWI